MSRYAKIFGRQYGAKSAVAALEKVVDPTLLELMVSRPDDPYLFCIGIGSRALSTSFEQAISEVVSNSKQGPNFIEPVSEKELAVGCIEDALRDFDGCITNNMGSTPYVLAIGSGRGVARVAALSSVGVNKIHSVTHLVM